MQNILVSPENTFNIFCINWLAEECNHKAVILVISVVLKGCPNMSFKRMTVFRLIMTGLYSVVMARRLFVVFGVL